MEPDLIRQLTHAPNRASFSAFAIVIAVSIALLSRGFPEEDSSAVCAELATMQGEFARNTERVIAPLRTDYIRRLDALRRTLIRERRPEAALAVEQEIARVEAGIVITATPPSSAVTISAADEQGTSLGDGKKGQKLTVQYVKGTWKLTPSSVEGSPDQPLHVGYQVALAGMINGRRERLALIPGETKAEPFTYVLAADYDQLFLMSADNILGDNSGEVQYNTKLQ